MNADQYWGTAAELTFIDTLGTHNPQSVKTSRLVWLQRYLGVMEVPREWGAIDKGAVMKHVKAEIRSEQRRVSRRAA